MDVVIPYIHGPQDGIELRLALRSIAANLIVPDGIRLIVLGDLPAWATGIEHVELAPLTGADSRGRDNIRKLKMAASMCPDGWVHTYDDVYFINPTIQANIIQRYHLRDLKGVDVDKTYKGTGTEWRQMLKRTMAALQANGYGCLNYENHMPRWYEPISTKCVMDDFDVDGQHLHFSTLYHNAIRPDAPKRALVGSLDVAKANYSPTCGPDWLATAGRNCRVLNHRNQHFTPELKKWLLRRFPAKCRYER